MPENLVEMDMVFEKETKNTVRYKAAEDGAHLETLYISKAAFAGAPPRGITVLVRAKE